MSSRKASSLSRKWKQARQSCLSKMGQLELRRECERGDWCWLTGQWVLVHSGRGGEPCIWAAVPASRSQISKLGALLLNLKEELVLIIVCYQWDAYNFSSAKAWTQDLSSHIEGFSVALYCSFGLGQAALVVVGCVLQWNSQAADKYTVLMEEFWDTTLNSLSKQVKWPYSRRGIWCACQKEVLRALCVLNVLNDGSSRRQCVLSPLFYHLRHNMLHPWHFRPF